jgi:protein-tyrosine kinase
MSLVEQAIKKMRAAGGLTDAAAPAERRDGRPAGGPIGQVVDTGIHRSPDGAGTAPPWRTDKIVRVDRQALRHAGLLPSEQQERAMADQYRQIKRPLISAAMGRRTARLENGQLIMMASAMPGDGKTFTSINLALSMSLEKDVSVLLVDADVAKPHISRIFGVDKEPGLLDVLREPNVAVESMILPTDVPNLKLLPAGTRSETATEMLASFRMEQTMKHLAHSDPTRIVVIDSPPLLVTSESPALAHAVGQVVLVVRAGFTPQQAVLDAIDLIGENKSVGLVLNQSMNATANYYYGYGGAGDAPPG